MSNKRCRDEADLSDVESDDTEVLDEEDMDIVEEVLDEIEDLKAELTNLVSRIIALEQSSRGNISQEFGSKTQSK